MQFQYGGAVEQVNVTATAASTTTLVGSTSSSATLGKQIQIFTGSSTQTVVLPNATTMSVGQKFEIYNESSSVLTIQFQDASVFTDAAGVNYNILAPHTSLVVKLQTNGTANGTWAVLSTASTGSGTGINYITYGNAEAGTQGWHTVNWQQAVTITNASPAVFTVTSTTGMYIGMPISFTTTGALPTGLTASTIYFISSIPSGSTFQVSATLGGAAVNTSSAGSGTHISYPLVPINDSTVALSNLTFATSSSNPLVGANSYTLVQTNSKPVGGEGAAYDFTIDAGYQAQVLSISTNYNASSTFIASSGSVGSDSDVEFAIWDKTNAVLIPVSTKFVTGNGSSNFTFASSFQASPNSTSYALMVFSPTMSANATGWTFKFDNVQVGPQVSSSNSTLPIGAKYVLSTSQTPGSNNQLNFDSKIFDTSGAVTTGTGAWKFTAPVSGLYQIDIGADWNTGSAGFLILYKNGSVYSQLAAYTSTGGVTSATDSIQLNAGDFIDVRVTTGTTFTGTDGASQATRIAIFLVSNSQPATGNTAGIAASYFMSANASPGINVQLNFDSKIYDTNNAVTTGTGAWKFTAPVSGFYAIDMTIGFSSGLSNGLFQLYKNGSILSYFGSDYGVNNSENSVATGSGTIQLNAGDFIDLRPVTSSTFAGSSLPYSTYISIHGIGLPFSSNGILPNINCRYHTSASCSVGAAQTANFDAKDYDTNAAVTASAPGTGSWSFKAPISGKYKVNMATLLTNATGSGSAAILAKNGTAVIGLMSVQNNIIGNGSTTIQLVAGDTLSILNSSTVTYFADGPTNPSFICIELVGF